MKDEDDKVGVDGLAEPVEVHDVAPLVLVAAGALLAGLASVAWLASRAWHSLGHFTFVLETDYERRDDGYWVP